MTTGTIYDVLLNFLADNWSEEVLDWINENCYDDTNSSENPQEIVWK
jgi:hypothetical protein